MANVDEEEIGIVKAGSTTTRHVEDDAQAAIDHEHNLTFREALKLYPKAVFWSVFFSLGVIMAAFDLQLVGNLFATPAFQRDFGYEFEGRWIISAQWQTGLVMGSPLGQVLGAFFAAYPMEWYGRKKTLGVCLLLSTGLIFIQFFARSLPVLIVGELLGGLVLGCYVVIAPAYASEVCPLALRGLLTSATNIYFVGGQLLANCIMTGTSKLDTHWAYSAPFAMQWFWPALILTALPFAPESPWWLQRRGLIKEAEDALERLASPQVDVKPALALIVETDRLEQEMEAGSTYLDCFKKINRRRTEIAAGAYSIQVLSGVYFIGYAQYFFQLAGLPTAQAWNMGIGILGMGFVGCCLSWVLLNYMGRRTIYNYGLAILATLQIIIAIIDCVPRYTSRPGLAWSQAVLMLVWNFVYDASIGPVCFVIVCEVSALRVRARTIAVATATQAMIGIVMTIAIPRFINPDQANARGKVGFFFGGLAALCLIWSWLRIPECKGRSYEELDVMFERKVKTRDFATYVVDEHIPRESM